MIANNGTGLEAQNTGALLQVSGSTVTGNGTGWATANGGQVISSGSSAIVGNRSSNSAPPSAVASSSPTPTPTSTPPSTANYLLLTQITFSLIQTATSYWHHEQTNEYGIH
jgi:hypothetical protein